MRGDSVSVLSDRVGDMLGEGSLSSWALSELVSVNLSAEYEPIRTTPSALSGTSQPETPSKKPPEKARSPLFRPAGHWSKSVMRPSSVDILTTPLAVQGTSQPDVPSKKPPENSKLVRSAGH